MLCPNCNHWNEAGSNFCEDCGADLTGVKADSQRISLKPASKPISKPVMPVGSVPPPTSQELIPAEDLAKPITTSGAHLFLESTGSIFRLGDKTVIGRENPSLEIDFEGYPNGQFVSGVHAQIIFTHNRYYLEDLGSSNHSYVNERRLAVGQLEPLNDGDKVRFGKIELTFHT